MTLAERELTKNIIACFYRVYDGLGYGFLESVYRRALWIEFRATGIFALCEAPFEVWYRNEKVGRFRGDFLVERKVIVELKASHTLAIADRKQVLNYLRASPVEVGLLLHFGPKPAFERLVYSNSKKASTRSDRRIRPQSAFVRVSPC